jgi:hypothetical protein
MADHMEAPVAAQSDTPGAAVGAPFVHEMFYAAYDAKSGDASAAQVSDEPRIAYRLAAEDALRDRRFDQEGLDPTEQIWFHTSSLIASPAGRLTR